MSDANVIAEYFSRNGIGHLPLGEIVRRVKAFDAASPVSTGAAQWIACSAAPIPESGLVDLLVNRERRTGCYFDPICDEWRQIERGIMVHFKRKDITHWMPLATLPIAAAMSDEVARISDSSASLNAGSNQTAGKV